MKNKESKRIIVLDKGFVELVDHMGSDQSVVDSARVSVAGDEVKSYSTNRQLIRYLMRHRHTTPSESVVFTFAVKAPILTVRQWHRHRSACLTGDTVISFQRPCDDRHYPKRLVDVYSLFKKNPEQLKKMKLRCINEDTKEVQITSVRNIWSTGVNEVFKVQTASGKVVRATENHKFLTNKGWKELKEINKGEVLFTYQQKAPTSSDNNGTSQDNSDDLANHNRTASYAVYEDEIISITPDGEEETFDMEVDDPWHNFFANGVVVHNSYNEMSARYGVLPDDFYIPNLTRMNVQAAKNHQGSGQGLINEASANRSKLEKFSELAYKTYLDLLDTGLAKELARSVLPVNIFTKMYCTVNMHNLFHFLSLRLDSHAQHEIRVYAEAMLELIRDIVPLSVEAFEDYRLGGMYLNRMEVEALSDVISVHASELSFHAGNLKELLGSDREVDEFMVKWKRLKNGAEEL